MTGGTPLRRIPSPSLDETQFCMTRPANCMGGLRMARACVLPLHHLGEHQAKDGVTFPRKVARRVVEERRAVGR